MRRVVYKPPDRAERSGAPLLALLALVGTWVGHTLEYLRVNGTSRLTDALTRSAHFYMLPLGLVLLAWVAVGGLAWHRAVVGLADRLDRLRHALRRGRRWQPRSDGAEAPHPSRPARLASIWLLLGVGQLALYLVQENVESRLIGLRAPGVGALLGQHWAAAPIHLAVAGVLAVAAVTILGHRLRLQRAVERHERVLARLWGGRHAPASVATASTPVLTPHERWGRQRWARPPPGARAA